MLRRQLILAPLAGLVAGCSPGGLLDTRAWSRRALRKAALREGALIIYANTGDTEIVPVLAAFRRANPGLRVSFLRQNSAELYARYLAESAAGAPTADLVWSSAMDLQIKLINDGYAQTFVAPDKAMLPPWAVWKNQGYGITAEPIVFVHDRRRLPESQAPRSHAELRQALETGRLRGSIGAFNPARSGVGFLYYSQDRQASADTLALNRAIGTSRPRLYESTATLLDGVSRGDTVLGYNVIGSYALEEQRRNPNLRVIFPSDYTLVMSRIAFVSAKARHPNAAKLFLDFMLSLEGQTLLARTSFTPVRTDLGGAGVPGPDAATARPIEVGPSLLANLDQMRREHMLSEWREAIGPDHTDDYRRVRDNVVTGNRP
jgi:iron(III) transport system substrate-binding protein